MLAQLLLTSALAFSGPVAPRFGRSSVTMAGKSAAVPFLPKPDHLDEALPGYAGFVRRMRTRARKHKVPAHSSAAYHEPSHSHARVCDANRAQDPLNLASSFDLKWMQEAELKHGRLAMLAVVGFIATDLGITAPGAPSGFSSVAAHDMAVEKGAMYVLLFAASLIEVTAGVPAVEQMMKGSGRKPGEFMFGEHA